MAQHAEIPPEGRTSSHSQPPIFGEVLLTDNKREIATVGDAPEKGGRAKAAREGASGRSSAAASPALLRAEGDVGLGEAGDPGFLATIGAVFDISEKTQKVIAMLNE